MVTYVSDLRGENKEMIKVDELVSHPEKKKEVAHKFFFFSDTKPL